MAELVNRMDNRISVPVNTDWSAIWGGLFIFAALWSVFGLLGYAIFSRAGVTGMNVGLAIWDIILTAVAMFVAGHGTARVAVVDNRFDGPWHGMIVFGLSVTAALVLMFAGNALFAGVGTVNPLAHRFYLTLFAGNGWAAFIGLFLGWLGAIVGASSGAARKLEQGSNLRNIRPAA